jgi:Major Facilitator Superfamily
MYRLEWIEQLKLRAAKRPAGSQVGRVSPVVWRLGYTSFLTDISAEMVNSALPGYLVLYLHMSPLQFGAIDGIYNGLAVVLVSVVTAIAADRTRRPKWICVAGYGLSAICKLFLLAGSLWSWIAGIMWLDRTGKGIRTAPRDAILSLSTSPDMLATAFAVHRALDAGGSLLGPLVTFGLLWRSAIDYNAVFAVSFVFAMIGLVVLWRGVPNPENQNPGSAPVGLRAPVALLAARPFRGLAACGLVLSLGAISDAFVYLLLQQKEATAAEFFPLFYVVTAFFYMVFSLPAGIAADRIGRLPVLLSGYVVLGLAYLVVGVLPGFGFWTVPLVLGLLGLYYAATEGVLTAMASKVIPAEMRTTGLAVLGTMTGIGKMVSSLLFGWLWGTYGVLPSIAIFGMMLAAGIVIAGFTLRYSDRVEA